MSFDSYSLQKRFISFKKITIWPSPNFEHNIIIYTIICLKSAAVRKLQVAIFLLDRLGKCLKLIVSSESISCHEFASQFGLEFSIREKTPNISLIQSRPHVVYFVCKWVSSRLDENLPLRSQFYSDHREIFLCIDIASPQHLDRSLFAFVLCFLRY